MFEPCLHFFPRSCVSPSCPRPVSDLLSLFEGNRRVTISKETLYKSFPAVTTGKEALGLTIQLVVTTTSGRQATGNKERNTGPNLQMTGTRTHEILVYDQLKRDSRDLMRIEDPEENAGALEERPRRPAVVLKCTRTSRWELGSQPNALTESQDPHESE